MSNNKKDGFRIPVTQLKFLKAMQYRMQGDAGVRGVGLGGMASSELLIAQPRV